MARSAKRRPMTDEQKARADEADYVAGFGKPPRASQFAKGKSGNPAGRPRGARSMRTLLQEILDQPVTISIKGVPRQVSAVRPSERRRGEVSVSKG